MKDGLRFVDCDMHVMEPVDLFSTYLDAKYRDRVILPLGKDGRPRRGMIMIDGKPTSFDVEMQKYRKRGPIRNSNSTQPLSGSRLADSNRLDFAIQRNYNAEAQVMAMGIEGVDIAVLFPTVGLSLIARDDMDPHLSLALCQAYNNWIHDFCQYSPNQLKFSAMLPLQDVNLAGQELIRCVTELGAVGSFVLTGRPPADGRSALRERLTRDDGIDVAADLPEVGSSVRALILALRERGCTVFFSSHILSDAEALCSRVAIVVGGQLVTSGSLSEILAFEVSGWELVMADLQDAAFETAGAAVRHVTRISEGRYAIEVAAEAEPERLAAELRLKGGRFVSLNPLRTTLEDYFVQQVTARNAEPPAGRAMPEG